MVRNHFPGFIGPIEMTTIILDVIKHRGACWLGYSWTNSSKMISYDKDARNCTVPKYIERFEPSFRYKMQISEMQANDIFEVFSSATLFTWNSEF